VSASLSIALSAALSSGASSAPEYREAIVTSRSLRCALQHLAIVPRKLCQRTGVLAAVIFRKSAAHGKPLRKSAAHGRSAVISSAPFDGEASMA